MKRLGFHCLLALFVGAYILLIRKYKTIPTLYGNSASLKNQINYLQTELPNYKNNNNQNKPRVFLYKPLVEPQELIECAEKVYGQKVTDEKRAPYLLGNFKGYLAEDMAELHLWNKIMNNPDVLTNSLEEANMILIDAFPIISSIADDCNGVNHGNRMKDVVTFMEIATTLDIPKFFICQSWECKRLLQFNEFSVAQYLNQNDVNILIHECNDGWWPDMNTKVVDRLLCIPIPYALHKDIRYVETANKKYFFTFIGEPRMGIAVRKADFWVNTNHTDVLFAHSMHQSADLDYPSAMIESVFCFNPRGDTPTSRRLFDSIKANCIPVVVSDGIQMHLPFRNSIPYDDIVVFIPEDIWIKEPERVYNYLKAMPQSEIEKRQNLMKRYTSSIDWWSSKPDMIENIYTEYLHRQKEREELLVHFTSK